MSILIVIVSLAFSACLLFRQDVEEDLTLGDLQGRSNAFSISNNEVIVSSNNDFIFRSEGGKKRPKNCGHP